MEPLACSNQPIACTEGNPDERIPISGRIRREIEITGPRPDSTIGPLGKLREWNPTHRHKEIPNFECMVTKIEPGDCDDVVHIITSYGGIGSEPARLFKKNWESIPQQMFN